MSPEAAKEVPFGKFDAAAYGRLQVALTQARSIIFTHEHHDHMGGVGAAPAFAAIAGKVMMTREQLTGPNLEQEAFAAGTLPTLKPFDYQGLLAIAPGVVLQKAPGHTAGTQLIYVELASGARYLFIGDIAWTEDNLKRQRGRPRLATLLFQEDRSAVAAQVQAIAALPKGVHIIIAHDPVTLARDITAGLLHQGFTR